MVILYKRPPKDAEDKALTGEGFEPVGAFVGKEGNDVFGDISILFLSVLLTKSLQGSR